MNPRYIRFWALFLIFCSANCGVTYGELPDPASAPSSASGRVAVRLVGRRVEKPTWSYIITHGMGGTVAGDRFELLAQAIKTMFPEAHVYLVDWSADATKKLYGIPLPWLVARSIDAVGVSAAQQLKREMIDRQRLTLIGESFGNDVNQHIAAELGIVERVLLFNPANELGGYGASDLQQHSDQSWAFHTRSPFDTSLVVSQRGLLLHTPHGLDLVGQHTYGIRWLRETIVAGDSSWLCLEREVFEGLAGMYDLAVQPDGTIDWEPVPRRRSTAATTDETQPQAIEVAAQ